MFHLTLKVAHANLESLFGQLVAVLIDKFVTREWTLHCKDLDEGLFAALIVVCLDDVGHTVPDGVRDIHADTLTHQRMTTLRVNDSTLFVHHVVVFQQTFTDTEVVLLNLSLSTFNLLGNHRALEHLALLEAELVHYGGDTLRTEQSHQLVFE